MNILAIHNRYRIPGGEDSVFENETGLLRAHGENVICYSKDNKDMEPRDLISDAVFSDKTYRGVRNLIRANEIDIVHVHNERFLISPSVFKAALDENVPVVRTLHNFRMLCINAMLYRDNRVCRECLKDKGTRKLPALIHGCYRNDRLLTLLNLRINSNAERHHYYDRVKFIALTEFNRDIFVGAGFNPDNIYVKPNFTYGFTRDEKAGETQRRDFLYLGRLDPAKGIEDILREWQKLPKEFAINVAGEGEEEYSEKLRAEFSSDNIRFLGNLPGEKAMKMLKGSKAMIFASRWYEGFPMTLIESFASGTPVIATDAGNGGSIVKGIYDSAEALLTDISALPDRIKTFDDDKKRGLYNYDKEKLKPYTPEDNYKQLMEIYDKCIRSW